eukprot:1182448-Prorocentrum_minimum.AAC.18
MIPEVANNCVPGAVLRGEAGARDGQQRGAGRGNYPGERCRNRQVAEAERDNPFFGMRSEPLPGDAHRDELRPRGPLDIREARDRVGGSARHLARRSAHGHLGKALRGNFPVGGVGFVGKKARAEERDLHPRGGGGGDRGEEGGCAFCGEGKAARVGGRLGAAGGDPRDGQADGVRAAGRDAEVLAVDRAHDAIQRPGAGLVHPRGRVRAGEAGGVRA